jgi:hypothetical protein
VASQPADDPVSHHVKAQNLAAVWPTYRAAGARCLIAVGSASSREIVSLYASKVPDTDLTLCRLRSPAERLTERIFRRGLGRGPVIPGPPPTTAKQRLAAMAAQAVREAAEMDAADFADLFIDSDNQNLACHAGISAASMAVMTLRIIRSCHSLPSSAV